MAEDHDSSAFNRSGSATHRSAWLLVPGVTVFGGLAGALVGEAVEGNPIMMSGLLVKLFGVGGAVLGFIVGLVLLAIRENSRRRSDRW